MALSILCIMLQYMLVVSKDSPVLFTIVVWQQYQTFELWRLPCKKVVKTCLKKFALYNIMSCYHFGDRLAIKIWIFYYKSGNKMFPGKSYNFLLQFWQYYGCQQIKIQNFLLQNWQDYCCRQIKILGLGQLLTKLDLAVISACWFANTLNRTKDWRLRI